jgi:subfamily B ATP-binding cassette protein MsbA
VLNSLADGLSISLLIPFIALLFRDGSDSPVDDGLLGELVGRLAAISGEGRELYAVSVLILALVAFRCIAGYVEGLIASWISSRISCDLRARMHENLLKVDFKYLCINDNGRLLNTLDSQAWQAADVISSCFGLVTSACMTLVFTSILLAISWKLTLLVAGLVGVVSLVLLLFDRRLRALGARSVRAAEDLSGRAVELFDAMRMIRAFGREPQAQAAYEHASESLLDISRERDRVGAAAAGVQEMLYAMNFVAVIFFALWLGMGGAALIGYLALLYRLQPHVRALDEARMDFASIDAVAAILDLEPWKPSAGDAVRLPALRQEIRFDNVTFAYSGKDAEIRNAVEDVSLTLPIGKVTAIVGWSGAGKSTLTNLLFRFYDPDSGAISVDGVPLARLDLEWWRDQLAIAGQDADLITGTIGENIAYGWDHATQADVIQAAQRASAHEFIASLPRGYDTRVGSRGILLSGGQRQRIGLARALVRRSPVLLLDEATNSVDAMTEFEILKALEDLRGNMTIVVIAHRLSATRTADQVIALAEGRVVEAGSPAELLRRNGLYAQMVHIQEISNSVATRATAPADRPALRHPS